MNAANVESHLRAAGHALTPQRRAVLRYLEGNLRHPTAAEVFAAVTAETPLSSRATVYNTLQLLADEGFVRVLRFEGEAELRYDPNTSAHHHRRCPRCGRLDDVAAERVEVLLDGRRVSADIRFDLPCEDCAER